MKEGDTNPSIDAQLTDPDDEPIDLTGIDDVRFELRDRLGEVVVDEDADVTDEAEGEVSYTWSDGDTDEAGDYRGQFVIDDEGEILTVPTEDWIDVYIERP